MNIKFYMRVDNEGVFLDKNSDTEHVQYKGVMKTLESSYIPKKGDIVRLSSSCLHKVVDIIIDYSRPPKTLLYVEVEPLTKSKKYKNKNIMDLEDY